MWGKSTAYAHTERWPLSVFFKSREAESKSLDWSGKVAPSLPLCSVIRLTQRMFTAFIQVVDFVAAEALVSNPAPGRPEAFASPRRPPLRNVGIFRRYPFVPFDRNSPAGAS
jgi:hypothetical protein